MKKLFGWILFFLIIGIFFWWNGQNSPLSSDKSIKELTIPPGEGVSTIADQLQDLKIIRSSLAFKIYAKLNGLAGKLQAGTFEVSPAMSLKEISNVLSLGTSDVKVTLVEGWRVEEMASRLKAELGIDDKQFVKIAKEGYMFPDTYLFPKNSTAESVASTLRDNFDRKYTAELQSEIKKQGLTSDQGVILASIVEREARSDKVRTNVASILLKRIKIGMALNADATVQYALGYQPAEKSWWKKALTQDDLKVDSQYNTYLHAGLPPTPICNPSLSSLEAVANADSSTPYLYYYHDSKGNSYYAKTLDEQNQNAANHP